MHTINVKNAAETFDCPPDQSLLSGMESQSKKAIAVGCRGGGCGFCKIQIVDGDFESKKMSVKFVTPEEREQGYALSCRIFPRSDMTIVAVEDVSSIKKTIK